MLTAKSNLANQHLQRAHFGTLPKHQPQRNSENPKICEDTILGDAVFLLQKQKNTMKLSNILHKYGMS